MTNKDKPELEHYTDGTPSREWSEQPDVPNKGCKCGGECWSYNAQWQRVEYGTFEGHQAALDKIAELEKRLEVSPDHPFDGIYCRDETIRQLEKENAELHKLRTEGGEEPDVPNKGCKCGGECWSYIETAPKDGTQVLLFDEEYEPQIISDWWHSYANGDGHWENTDKEEDFYPTHWMPLPTTPTESERD